MKKNYAMHTGNLTKHDKKLAVLVDPDKIPESGAEHLLKSKYLDNLDYIFVGGSLLFNYLEDTISHIKSNTSTPVIIFPGNAFQISSLADAFILLNLISGRNPDLLIGHHVMAAPKLHKLNIPVVSTGYMLFACGKITSVQYMSNTTPIPADKPDLAVATAMAGEMIGMKQLYLEAGSGADYPVPPGIVEAVSKTVNIPVIVGGGIRNRQQAIDAWQAGASLVVVGNATEKNPALIESLISARAALE